MGHTDPALLAGLAEWLQADDRVHALADIGGQARSALRGGVRDAVLGDAHHLHLETRLDLSRPWRARKHWSRPRRPRRHRNAGLPAKPTASCDRPRRGRTSDATHRRVSPHHGRRAPRVRIARRSGFPERRERSCSSFWVSGSASCTIRPRSVGPGLFGNGVTLSSNTLRSVMIFPLSVADAALNLAALHGCTSRHGVSS